MTNDCILLLLGGEVNCNIAVDVVQIMLGVTVGVVCLAGILVD
jgi:hypothetical protein